MKAIILAGGTGSRLLPLTLVTNKHLLPIGPKPMIQHLIDHLEKTNIKEVMIITGKEHADDIINYCRSGILEFTYRVQENAGGIGHALYLCKSFVGQDNCLVLLGDNMFDFGLQQIVNEYAKGCLITVYESPNPQRFGCCRFEGSKLAEIIEKPTSPPSNTIVTGIYVYDNEVFNIIKDLKPSKRGEIEITDVNNIYLSRGKLSYIKLGGFWTDAGTFDSYYRANEYFR